MYILTSLSSSFFTQLMIRGILLFFLVKAELIKIMLKDKIEREHRLIYKVFIYHLFYYNDNEAFIILKDIYTDIFT